MGLEDKKQLFGLNSYFPCVFKRFRPIFMKAKNFFFIYLILFSIFGFGQQTKDKYNLDFEYSLRGSSWLCILDDFRAMYDSTNKVNGARSLLLTRSYLKTEFNLSLSQTILLPKPTKTIKVSLSSQYEYLFSAGLKISGLDKNRNLLASDSVSLIKNDGWEKFEVSITSDKAIELLLVEIKAKETFKEKKPKVKLWVDNIQIALDGIDLYSCKSLDYQYDMDEIADIKEYVPLSDQLVLPEKVLNGIDSRIIGFGETAHGSNEIAKSVFNNIEQLIVNHNCRLVLLELPIDLGIRLNQFVHQDVFDEDIKGLIDKYHIDYEALKAFLIWLKQYNITNEDKVSVFGVDNYSDYSTRHIKNYLLSKK